MGPRAPRREGRNLIIKQKKDLSEDELSEISKRINSEEHSEDIGPSRCWEKYQNGLYAFYLKDEGNFVGLAEASGRPIVSPGWWVDTRFREKGYGRELVDVLANFLRSDGVTGVGEIKIDGPFYEASERLVRQFREHFQC